MMRKNEKKKIDKSTEEKIKIAAEKLFMERGFAGTRTRDIADAAGINLALLNYYYRSKENLFDLIAMEKIEKFITILIDFMKDKTISFPERIESLVNTYTDLLIKEETLLYFIMSGILQNPDFFAEKLNVRSKTKGLIFASEDDELDMQLLLDFMGLTFAPFLIRNAIEKIYKLGDNDYPKMLNERKGYVVKILTDLYLQATKSKTQQ